MRSRETTSPALASRGRGGDRRAATRSPVKLRDVAPASAASFHGDGEIEIERVRSIEDAGAGDLTFSDIALRLAAPGDQGAAIILPPDAPAARSRHSPRAPRLLAFARRSISSTGRGTPSPGLIQPHRRAKRDDRRRRLDRCVRRHRRRRDDRTRATIFPHVVIYPGARIGADLSRTAGVIVREEVVIGDRVVLHAGVVIGADGFGFVPVADGDPSRFRRPAPSSSRTNVEIGAKHHDRSRHLGCDDRAARREARQPRHGRPQLRDRRGELARRAGGPRRLDQGRTAVQMGGQAGSRDISPSATARRSSRRAGVPSSVAAGAIVGGYPALEVSRWRRISAALLRLPDLLRRVRRLERAVGIAHPGAPDERDTRSER